MITNRSSFRPRVSKSATSVASKFSGISLTSTVLRQHKTDFAKFYPDLCKLQHSTPLKIITKSLSSGTLNITADRIKFDDWCPIVTALATDVTLHDVTVTLRPAVASAIMDSENELKARISCRSPAVVTKFVLYSLVDSLRIMLSTSSALTTLHLAGLPINGEFLQILVEGLAEIQHLQHLSLAKCSIHDEGAEILQLALRNSQTLLTLDLTGCQLTEYGAASIAKLISIQKLSRYSETWKHTLRYRDPDLEAMTGLRRLTLNHNPAIGDRGVEILTENLRDDLWLRALDLQNTGMSDVGALHLAQLLRSNPTLVVIDPRANPAMSNERASEIIRYLAINNADKMHAEYKWLRVEKSAELREIKDLPQKPARCPAQTTTNHRKLGSASAPMLSSKPSKQSLEEQVYRRENEVLQNQVKDLNQILQVQIGQKAEVERHNQFLKDLLSRTLKDKENLEESLKAIDGTFQKMADLLATEDFMDPEVLEVFSELKNVLRCLRRQEDEDGPNGLHDKVNNMRKKNQVIPEENESDSSSGYEEKRKKRTESKKSRKTKENLERREKTDEEKAMTEAQRIFAKIIGSSYDEESLPTSDNLSS